MAACTTSLYNIVAIWQPTQSFLSCDDDAKSSRFRDQAMCCSHWLMELGNENDPPVPLVNIPRHASSQGYGTPHCGRSVILDLPNAVSRYAADALASLVDFTACEELRALPGTRTCLRCAGANCSAPAGTATGVGACPTSEGCTVTHRPLLLASSSCRRCLTRCLEMRLPAIFPRQLLIWLLVRLRRDSTAAASQC